MFESSELTGSESDTLTFCVMFVVSLSILYFGWVLFSELWIAFYPETPLPLLCIKAKVKKEEDDVLEEVDFVKFDEAGPQQVEKQGANTTQLQMKLETAEQMIQQQQSEIARLKKAGAGTAGGAVQQAFAVPGGTASKKPVVKVKKEFSTSASGNEFEVHVNPMRRQVPTRKEDDLL